MGGDRGFRIRDFGCGCCYSSGENGTLLLARPNGYFDDGVRALKERHAASSGASQLRKTPAGSPAGESGFKLDRNQSGVADPCTFIGQVNQVFSASKYNSQVPNPKSPCM